ncbi:sugar MFS transporter [Hephaestia mangrovi]|uniref:sugar MFS transporter n=1 Tax=Hephaestia mangrovi TaxID=2873268 RepID=UPI001CA62CBB|nr:sugar MFS transporter [Hephaestia mangrovi]MBY8829805.1 sugar MFS transporter [Hephaestia mangrovi]
MERTKSAGAAFAAVTTLFFAWGFITSIVDPLVAAVKSIFSLTNVEAQVSTFAFFIAYGVVSIPAAILVSRLRAVPSIILAIAMMVAACLIMLAGADAAAYTGVLIGLFVMASGITILQVAANPLAAALGVPERSHFRLTLSQAFNSFGTVLGPLLGASLLLRGIDVKPGETLTPAARTAALGSINTSFLIIAVLLAVLGGFIWLMRRRITEAAPPLDVAHGFGETLSQVFASRWALLGGLAIFLYVGAEVSIGSQMALFLNSKPIWAMPLQQAGFYVSLYWGGAMIGRFIGSALLTQVKAYRLLAINAAIATLLCLFVVLTRGVPAGWAALGIGLFNSIMFPVIFTLTLERSTASTEATSGFLCTSIIGGALVPLLVGKVADMSDYATALAVPLACYVVLFLFALAAGRAPIHAAGVDEAKPTLH